MEVRLKIFNRLLNNLIKVKNRGKLTQINMIQLIMTFNLYRRLSIIAQKEPKT